MGGLHKSLPKLTKKLNRVVDPFGHLQLDKITKKTEDFADDNVWGGPAEVENPNPELPKVIEMPDEDAIAKARKRKTSQQRGSAARGGTILSDGLGG